MNYGWIVYLVLFISMVGIIFIHEFCHLMMGCLVGKKPKIFSVGFWRPYLSCNIRGIECRITPFLFGGFVSFAENLNKSTEEVKKLSLGRQLLIYVSGCAGNILSGGMVLLLIGVYLGVTDLFRVLWLAVYEITSLIYFLTVSLITGLTFEVGVGNLSLLINRIVDINSFWIIVVLLSFLGFSLLSIITGAMNLILFPPLDGWHILQGLIEKVRGKNFSYRTNVILTYFGLSSVIVFSLYIIYCGIAIL